MPSSQALTELEPKWLRYLILATRKLLYLGVVQNDIYKILFLPTKKTWPTTPILPPYLRWGV